MYSHEFFVQYKGVAGQTDMAEYVSLSDQRRMHITLPPLPEQRAIAHILGTLDDKIELNRRMSETLEQMARALFKAWFVDFEPVRAKMEGRWRRGESLPGLPAHLYDLFPDRLVDSELGEIPEGWGVKGLDEIARFLNGLALQKYPPTDNRSLPVIKIAQLRAGNTSGADQASADISPEYVVDDGDILFSWSGSLECVVWTGGKGALNQHLFKVSSDGYPRWLCYFAVHMHLEDFRRIAAGKATTMGHIQRHHLSDARLAVPPVALLGIMDSYISPTFEASWKQNLESRTLAALRDTLLPKLIRGEIRVKDAERFLEERGV
jgi:type I restriction enzyme S subunit